MAYDTHKNLKEFSDFFTVHIISERDISRSNSNTKIPESILKCIKHEYSLNKDTTSTKGLFSNDKIMAYIYVFDYYDEKSLDDMLELNYSITTDEMLKITDDNLKTIKCFVCNKFPLIIEDLPNGCVYSEYIDDYIQKDRKVSDIMNKIQRRLDKDGKFKKNAKNLTFFTSAKGNMGVYNCFNSILNLIKQNDDLWKKITYEDKKKIDEENNDDEEKTEETGFFCCKSKKIVEDKSLENKDNVNESVQPEQLKFNDDDDEAGGYDMNINIKPIDPKEEEEKKQSGCIIF